MNSRQVMTLVALVAVLGVPSCRDEKPRDSKAMARAVRNALPAKNEPANVKGVPVNPAVFEKTGPGVNVPGVLEGEWNVDCNDRNPDSRRINSMAFKSGEMIFNEIHGDIKAIKQLKPRQWQITMTMDDGTEKWSHSPKLEVDATGTSLTYDGEAMKRCDPQTYHIDRNWRR